MNEKPKTTEILMCWSGGKDSCMALDALLRDTTVSIRALLTTVTQDFDRISMHGVRRSLLHQQAQSLGLPLREVMIPKQATNAQYEASMAVALADYRAAGIDT